jgi:hypothetical protein
MKALVSGSRSIGKLPDSAIKKIDSLMDRNCAIVTGDAEGAETEIQKYLLKKNYDNVIVYSAGEESAMADDADCALMLWDGVSIGTLNVIKAMKNRNKRCCVVVDGTLYDEEDSDVAVNTLINR